MPAKVKMKLSVFGLAPFSQTQAESKPFCAPNMIGNLNLPMGVYGFPFKLNHSNVFLLPFAKTGSKVNVMQTQFAGCLVHKE